MKAIRIRLANRKGNRRIGNLPSVTQVNPGRYSMKP